MPSPNTSDLRTSLPEGTYTPDDDVPPTPRRAAASPLDEEPVRRRPQAKAAKKGRTKITVENDGGAVEVEDGASAPVPEPAFDDESPLDADAEAQSAMCEVERVGPGDGPGWDGMSFNGIAVSRGRVGYLPRTRDIYDRVQSLVGGAEYSFVTKGRPRVFKKLPGAPKALPGEDVDYQTPAGYGLGEHGLFPLNGGGRGFTIGGPGFGFQHPQGPIEGDGMSMELPADAGSDPDGLDGFVFHPGTNQWHFYRGGRRSPIPRGMRPPAAPGAFTGGFNPGMYDHADDEKKNPRLDAVEKTLEKIATRLERPEDPAKAIGAMLAPVMTMMTAMMASQSNQQTAAATAQAQAAQAQATASIEVAKHQAAAAKEAAVLQAAAMQANNGAALTAAKEMAALQANHTTQLMTVLSQKQEEGGIDRMFERFANWQELTGGGGKGSDNAAVQISEAIRSVVPTLSESVRDTVYAVKGLPIPGPGGAAAPTDPIAQAQQPPAAAPGAAPNAQSLGESGQYMQLVGYLGRCVQRGMKPTTNTLANGCLAYNLDAPAKWEQVCATVLQITPDQAVELVVQTIKQGGLSGVKQFQEFVAFVQGTVLSPQGRQWFAALQKSVAKHLAEQQEAAKAAAAVAAAPPPSPIAPTPAPAAPAPAPAPAAPPTG